MRKRRDAEIFATQQREAEEFAEKQRLFEANQRERQRAQEPKKLPTIWRETLLVDGPPWLREMNERHAMIGNYGSKCVIVEWAPSIAFPGTMEMQHQSLTSFRERYLGRYIHDPSGMREPIVPTWLNHSDHRYYDGIAFEPNEDAVIVKEDGRRLMNLWRGWGVNPKEGDWSLIHRHIYDVLAAGDRAFGDYAVRWCAWKFQNPGEPSSPRLALAYTSGAEVANITTTLNSEHRYFHRYAKL